MGRHSKEKIIRGMSICGGLPMTNNKSGIPIRMTQNGNKMSKEYAEDIIFEELMRAVKAMNSKRIRDCEVATDEWTRILETMYGKIAQTVLAAQANLAKIRLNNEVLRQMGAAESELFKTGDELTAELLNNLYK